MLKAIVVILALIACKTLAAPKPSYYVSTGPLAYSAYSPLVSPYLVSSYVSPWSYGYNGFGYDYGLYPSPVVVY